MPHDVAFSLRIPRELSDRIEALRKSLVTDATLAAAGGVARSVVVRLALERGIAALEKDGGAASPKRPRAR